MADTEKTLKDKILDFSSSIGNLTAILSLSVLVYEVFKSGISKSLGLVLTYFSKLVHVVTYPLAIGFTALLDALNAQFGLHVSLIPRWRYLAVAGLCSSGIFLRSIKAISSRILLAISLIFATGFYCTDVMSKWFPGSEDLLPLFVVFYLALPFLGPGEAKKSWISIPGFTDFMIRFQKRHLPTDDGDKKTARMNALVVLFGTLFFILANAGLSMVGL